MEPSLLSIEMYMHKTCNANPNQVQNGNVRHIISIVDVVWNRGGIALIMIAGNPVLHFLIPEKW